MTEDPEEKAREEAEARRQKILQSSNDRLGLVTGAVPALASDGHDAGEEDEEARKAKTMSKMAQARRRRFKKKDGDGAAPPAVAESAPTSEAAAVETTSAPPAPAEATPAAAEPSSETKADVAEPEAAKEEKAAVPVDATATANTAKEEEEQEGGAVNKKKYQGVARIRRQMLKERHERSKTGPDDSSSPKSGGGGGGEKGGGAEPSSAAGAAAVVSHKPLSRRARWYATLPIVMHLVTTLLLFMAGLDVGMQQRPSPLAVVETEWAPTHELLLLRIVPGSLWKNRTAADASASDPFLPSADELLQMADARELVVEDEFAVGGDDDKDGLDGKASAQPPTIDPLFGVDLDLYTQGDALYMVLGRFAVRVHRALLSVVYYLPIRAYGYMLATLQQLAKSPPLLCLLAITIRQVIGKAILGAKLPSPKSLEDDSSSKEVTNMIVRAVKGFFLKAFPNVFTLYDIFSHVKNDMYVVLCGLLVGLAFRHSVLMSPEETNAELTGSVIDSIIDEEAIPVGTDEL